MRVSVLAWALLLAGAQATFPAHANHGGINGYSGNPVTEGGSICNLCHKGGTTPLVTLAGPTVVDGGAMYTYTLSVAGGQGIACGLDVSAEAGSFVAFEPGTEIFFEEVTHSAPRVVDGLGQCVFAFDWTAPLVGGPVNLYGVGNSVDLDDSTAGDAASQDVLTITVVGAPPGQIPPVADANGPHSSVVGEVIVFNGSGSTDGDGVVVAYDWDFGDGDSGSGVNPSHAYEEAGTYTVQLTVTDEDGFTDVGATSALILLEPGPLRAERLIESTVLRNMVYMTAPSFDPRLFLLRQKVGGAVIFIYENGTLLADPFLTIANITNQGAEGGLKGMAFPPDYASTGLFYVLYSDVSLNTVVSRFQVSNDPNIADASSEEILLSHPQPTLIHPGSHIEFGPNDGYLYVALGDGGGSFAESARAQDDSTLNGKMLRLDVSGGLGSGYSIPHDNPFVGPSDPLDEIWAKGLRNPYRFDIDPLTGDIYIADVGQTAREEVSVDPGASFGGRNFGWNIMEGTLCHGDPAVCSGGTLKLPIHEYDHSDNHCAIIGGSVYRGSIASLQGRFFFADHCTSQIWSLAWDGAGGVVNLIDHTAQLVPDVGEISSIAAIGTDGFGELYVVDRVGGELFKVIAPKAVPALSPMALLGLGSLLLAAGHMVARKSRIARRKEPRG